ncbi:MAG: hypothetical protein KF795_30710, partial [Labilithrix sp.]|nr:hypothetical protein [Labilithrix sp.]
MPTFPSRASRAALCGILAVTLAIAPACSSEDPVPNPTSGATSSFDPAARFDAPGAFFDFPYPSDRRLTADGAPDVAAFPDEGIPILQGVKVGASQRKGFPVLAAGYFRFNRKLAPRDLEVTIAGDARAPLLLIDVDEASPERGKLFPVVASTPEPDPYIPEFLLAVGARPGIVLIPNRKYAFVVTNEIGLEDGSLPAPAPAFAEIARGEGDPALQSLYAPLWSTLDTLGVPRAVVVNATVFTTGDVVAESAALSDRVVAAH